MSLVRLFAQRIALGFVAAWAVLTAVFGLFTLTDDWVLEGELALMQFGGADEEVLERAREAYLAERGLDRPLGELYVDWMIDMLTLEWGVSFVHGEPVLPLVMDATIRTAMYVVPAIVVALGFGICIGLYAAVHPDSWLANSNITFAYVLFAIPNFWVGGVLVGYAAADVIGYSNLLFDHVLPIALAASTLLGGYVSYARAHSLEYSSAEFVTLVKAKGASRIRVAKHVVRNAAIPLFSMLFTEALALLVLAVFVIEVLFGIDGFGLLLFESVQERDLPVVLGGTIVIIGAGVIGNIVQDLSYNILDPRVDTGTR